MIPAAFEYLAPHTVEDVIGLLEKHGDDAKVLAGGQSLIPLMKFRLAQPAVLIDVNRVPGLDFIQETDGDLYLGPLSRESDVEASDMLARRWPILVDASRVIADPIVRNMATVGGNVAHGDPANDHPAVMLALRAQLTAQGSGGKRTIPVDQFFVDTFQTALEPTEMLVEIRAPAQPARSGGAYFKLERKVGDFAVAGVAAQISLSANDTFERAGLGLTNVGPRPIRADQAEAFLMGKTADEATLRQAGDLAAQQAQPISDHRGSVDYKRGIVRTLTVRALRQAVERAQGGTR